MSALCEAGYFGDFLFLVVVSIFRVDCVRPDPTQNEADKREGGQAEREALVIFLSLVTPKARIGVTLARAYPGAETPRSPRRAGVPCYRASQSPRSTRAGRVNARVRHARRRPSRPVRCRAARFVGTMAIRGAPDRGGGRRGAARKVRREVAGEVCHGPSEATEGPERERDLRRGGRAGERCRG